MWVRRMASRSETESPRNCNCALKVSKVDAGPGSRIALWPSDSKRTAPIERGRPIQFRSSTVVESICEWYGSVATGTNCASHTLSSSAAANCRRRGYTNGMTWSRRAFGVMLSSALLLMIALPTVCGNCQTMAVKADCAEDHGGKTKHTGSSSLWHADCDHCDGSQGISPFRHRYQTVPEYVVLSDIAKTPRLDSNRIITAFAATIRVMYLWGAFPKSIFAGKAPVPNSVYHPLTVSLKI